MTDELEAIHKRHEADDKVRQYTGFLDAPTALKAARQAHTDRATLLRLLSEERARRVEVEGAARNIVEGMQLSEYESLPDNRGFSTRLVNWNHEQDFTIGDLRRLARATNKDTQDE